MKKASYYLGIADMKLSELHRPTRKERNDLIIEAIKQAQIEAIEETANACAELTPISLAKHLILKVADQLKAKL